MADRENEKKYSAETKGYTDKIYEVRFMPVLERSEYQADRNVRDSLSYKELWKKKISRNILIMD